MSVIKTNIIYSENINDDVLLSYTFETPSEDFSTAGTYATVLYANNSIIIEGYNTIKNIYQWLDIDDTITGDLAFFTILKEFRYTSDNYNYSPWFPLNKDNLSLIDISANISTQFRYSAIASQQDYDLLIPVKKPNNTGWFNLVTTNSTTPYNIEKDYPNQGNLTWTLGWGTNGQYHINTITSKIYQKSNGAWTGGAYFERSTAGTTGITYIPTQFKGVTLTDEFINSITSQYGVVPINDYVLTTDLKFGADSINAKLSTVYRPQNGDLVFINPLLQGINLKGIEELKATYEYTILPEGYTPKVFVKNIDLYVKQHINTVVSDPLFCLENIGDQTVFKPPFLLKVYSIDSLYVEVDGQCSTSWNSCLDIKFRYSFNSRTWDTQWMPLTLSNLKCIKPNPLKFFYVEFLFTKTCDNNGNPICVSDIIINGNIQNVTKDYEKLNRFGLRSDCNYGEGTVDENGYTPTTGICDTSDKCVSNDIIPIDWVTDLDICATNVQMFNPYDNKQLIAFNEKLENDTSNLFGWEIDYYKTEANEAGIDRVLHEYGTYDTVMKKKVKIIVPDNKFPEDQIGFNMFDLSLFDSFQILITRKEFHSKFGIGVRPANEDYLWLCQINKWYKVEHAQSHRDFLNSAIHYQLTLVKKQDDTHIDNGDYTTEFNSMVENNQLDNLFGKDVKEDIDKVVNVPDLQTLTEINAIDTKFKYDDDIEILVNKGVDKEEILDYKNPDPIILTVGVPSIETNLENGQTIISQNYYDLTSKANATAIVYQKLDNSICDCCNRAFSAWFSITTYQAGMVYNLINNYDNLTNKGYKIDFVDGNLNINFYGQLYQIDISLSVGKWYALVVNFNQKQSKLEVYLYKRKGLCNTNELDLLDEIIHPLVPVEYTGDLTLKLMGSYMSITNIRLWSEIIMKSEHSKVLSQYVVKETEYLILSDSGSKSIIAPHWKY